MLTHVLARAKEIPGVDEVVVTTTPRAQDDALVNLCRGAGVRWSRGQRPLVGDPKRNDVLAGYVVAAETSRADVVVRLTSDCPLLDPAVAGEVLARFLAERGCAYASNVHPPSWHDGCDVEIIHATALRQIEHNAAPDEREHVTTHLWRHPERYPQVNVLAPGGENYAGIKLSVDTAEDLARVRRVWQALPRAIRREGALMTWRAVIRAYRETHPPPAEVRARALYGERSETAGRRAAYLAGVEAASRAVGGASPNPWSTADAPALATAWTLGWEDVAVLGRSDLATT